MSAALHLPRLGVRAGQPRPWDKAGNWRAGDLELERARAGEES